jgi:hypothetical protein
MKQILNELLFGKDAKLSGLIALAVVMMIAMGCTCGGLNKLSELSKDNKSSNTAENKSSKESAENSSKDSPFPSDEATPKKIENSGQKKSKDKNMPSDDETESLVKDLIRQFKDGVENEDFTDMRDASSSAFKKVYTNDAIVKSFDVFIKSKERVGNVLDGIDDLTPEYTTEPSISVKNGYKILTTKGTFATSPTTTFNASYVLEKGSWKMLTVEIKIQ